MNISASVPLTNVDDVKGSKIGDPAVQLAQFEPGNQNQKPQRREGAQTTGACKMS